MTQGPSGMPKRERQGGEAEGRMAPDKRNGIGELIRVGVRIVVNRFWDASEDDNAA